MGRNCHARLQRHPHRPRQCLRRGREDGAYYSQTWQAAIDSNPDWVIITSFNEWPEGTYIEPSQAYGDRYLGLTAEWAGRFKSGEAIAYTPPAPSNPSPSEGEAGRGSGSSPRRGRLEGVPTPVPTPSYAAVRVQTPVLNLRSEPGTAGPRLAATAGSVWRPRAGSPAADGGGLLRRRPARLGQWQLVQPIGPAELLDQVPVVELTAGRRSLLVD